MVSILHRYIFYFTPLIASSIWSIILSKFWPVLPAGFLVTLLLLLYDIERLTVNNAVIGSVISGLIYRGTIWIATPSMIGQDPDKYAVGISVVSNEGLNAISDLGFYGSTLVYHIFNILVVEVSGLSPAAALQLTSVLLYATVPVLTVVRLSLYFSGLRAAKFGSVLSAAGGASIVYSTLTIPQGVMAILWYLVAILLIIKRRESKFFGVFVIFTLIMAGLHKLGVIVVLGAVIAVAMADWIVVKRTNQYGTKHYTIYYFLVTTVIFSLQMLWVTNWIKAVVSKIVMTIYGGTRITGTNTVSETTAIGTLEATRTGGIDIIFFEHGFWVILVPIAGVVGTWVFYKDTNGKFSGLIGVASMASLLILGAVATSFSLSVERAIVIGEPFFIILVVIGTVAISRRSNHSVGSAIIGILLISQLATVSAVPDHPNEIQEYLTEDEVQAKQWANVHIEQEIYSNHFVAQEIINYQGDRATYVTGEGGGFPEGWSPASGYLVTGDLTRADGCFFLRSNQNMIRYNGLYQLSYDLLMRLEQSNRQRIFDNSNIVTYC